MKCIICNSESVPDASVVRGTPAYDCPKCGTFRVSDTTSAIIARQATSPEAVTVVSAAVLKLDRNGERYPLVDFGLIESVLQRHGLRDSRADLTD